ncbi:hypothetical protein AB1Y20_009270 [Prymnesium parvum]|uniref:USP domain-containing protein n=1 Tax=Prymnesium parvum TaxID=97485 RepID=A0AB34JZV7_PRYPA
MPLDTPAHRHERTGSPPRGTCRAPLRPQGDQDFPAACAKSFDASLARAVQSRAALDAAHADAKKRQLSPKWYEARPAEQRYAGLANEGSTCYLNSLLQALFVCAEVRREVHRFRFGGEETHGPRDMCVPLQLSRLFARLERSSRLELSTRELISSFGWSKADAFRQHDVQELCRVLFSALGKFGVPLEARLFEGASRSVLRCLECGRESARVETWTDIQLGVDASSELEQALRELVRPETLEGENAWFCEGCAARVAALKEARLERLPPLLMIMLNRFTFDLSTMRRKKLNHRVGVPMELDMAPYCRQESEGEMWYDCVGLLLHSGSAQGGHYTALLRPDSHAKWHLFNDSRVSEASASTLDEAQGEGEVGSAGPSGNNAYLLIYRRRSGEGGAVSETEAEEGVAHEVCEEVDGEEEEARRLRELEEHAECVAELTVLPAHDVEQSVLLKVHADMPIAALPRMAFDALPRPLDAATPLPAAPSPLPAAPDPPSGRVVADGFELRLRRWDHARAMAEEPIPLWADRPSGGAAPVTAVAAAMAAGAAVGVAAAAGKAAEQAAAEGVAAAAAAEQAAVAAALEEYPSVRSLLLAPRGAVLLEARPEGMAWPAASKEDLYVRMRRWKRREGQCAEGGGGTGGDGGAAGGCDVGEVGPAAMVCVPEGLLPAASLSQLRHAVGLWCGVWPPYQRLVRIGGKKAEVLGHDGGDAGVDESAWSIGQLRLHATDEILVEQVESAEAPSELAQLHEAKRSRILLCYNALGSREMDQPIQADTRETVGSLKARIAALLGEAPAALRLRKGERGAHLKDEDSTLLGDGGAGLCDGGVVYVEEGTPLRAGEVVLRYYKTAPVGCDEGQAGEFGGASTQAEGGDCSRMGADPLAVKVQGEAMGSLVVSETLKILQLKQLIGQAHTWGEPSEESHFDHTRLRLYKRSGARTGAVLRDHRNVRASLSGGFDDKEVAVQLLSQGEQLGEEGLLVRWQLVEPSGVASQY